MDNSHVHIGQTLDPDRFMFSQVLHCPPTGERYHDSSTVSEATFWLSLSSHPYSTEFITGHRTHEAHLALFDLPMERKVLLAVKTLMEIYLPEGPVGASGGQWSLWSWSLHSDGQAQLGGTASRCHIQEQPGLQYLTSSHQFTTSVQHKIHHFEMELTFLDKHIKAWCLLFSLLLRHYLVSNLNSTVVLVSPLYVS